MIELTEYQKALMRENTKISWSIWAITVTTWIAVVAAMAGINFGSTAWENIGYFGLLCYVVFEWITLAFLGIIHISWLVVKKTNQVVESYPELKEDEDVMTKKKEATDKFIKVLLKLVVPVDLSRKIFFYVYHSVDNGIDAILFLFFVLKGFPGLAFFHIVATTLQHLSKRKLRRQAIDYLKNLAPETDEEETIDELCDKLFDDSPEEETKL